MAFGDWEDVWDLKRSLGCREESEGQGKDPNPWDLRDSPDHRALLTQTGFKSIKRDFSKIIQVAPESSWESYWGNPTQVTIVTCTTANHSCSPLKMLVLIKTSWYMCLHQHIIIPFKIIYQRHHKTNNEVWVIIPPKWVLLCSHEHRKAWCPFISDSVRLKSWT